jgi:hypothetical protein
MKKYFTHNEGGEKGPFDIEEIKISKSKRGFNDLV